MSTTDEPAPARLTRTPDDKVVAGVAGGLGRYFGLDPVIFRIAFVALALLGGGTGILLYVIGWIAMPEGQPGAPPASRAGRDGSTVAVAVVLLVVGGLLLLERLARMGDPWGPARGFWPGFGLPLLPLALIGLGVWVLVSQRQDGGAGGDAPPPDRASGTTPFAGSAPATATSTPAPPPPAPAPAPAPAPPPAPPPVRAPRSPLGPTVLSVLLIVGGGAALLDVSGAVEVSLVGFLAVALILTGAGLVVGAWWGRARGLVALGIVLTLLLGFARVVDVNVAGGIGERVARPATPGEVDDRYRLGMGSLTLDLRDLDAGRIAPVEARVGIGELVVVLPFDAPVVVTARSGIGEVDLFGHSEGGVGVERRVADAGAGRDPDDVEPGDELEIDAQVGIGRIEVRRG